MRRLLAAAVAAAAAFPGSAYAASPGYTGYYLDAGGACRSFLVGVVVDRKFCAGAPQCKTGASPCFANGQLACVAPDKVSPKNKACLK